MLHQKLLMCMLALLVGASTFAQTGKLYLNIVSHNEPGDSLELQSKFFPMAYRVMDLADMVVAKGAKWNLGTCDGFVNGALDHQSGGTTPGDLFETLANPPYADHVEVDPRNKNDFGHNVADLVYLIDSCGGNPSNNLSGFIWNSTQPTQPDWFRYENTQLGLTYSSAWKADVIWGAGSLPPHANDLNDYGTWMPDTVNNFTTHNPNRSLWYQGNGCQPLQSLDSTESVQVIIDLIQANVDSLSTGLWPSNQFYSMSVVIDQDQFGPMLLQKMGMLIDSVNALGTANLQWATTTEKHLAFLAMQTSTPVPSFWACSGRILFADEPDLPPGSIAFPNPFQAQLHLQSDQAHLVELFDLQGARCLRQKLEAGQPCQTDQLRAGLYLLIIDGKPAGKVEKLGL